MAGFLDKSENEASLVKSLRRLTFCAIAAVVLLVLVTSLLGLRMKGHVAKLNAFDEIYAARDDAFAALADMPPRSAFGANSAAEEAMASVALHFERFRRLDPQNPWAPEARSGIERARSDLRIVAQSGEDAYRHLLRMQQSLTVLSREIVAWKSAIQIWQAEVSDNALLSQSEQKGLSAKLTQLSEAILTAVRIQREIDGVARYNLSQAGQNIRRDQVTVSTEELPAPCTASERALGAALCTPSTQRVHSEIAALVSSPPEQFQTRLDRANWALEAYARTGEKHFRDIQARLDTALNTAARASANATIASEKLRQFSQLRRTISQLESRVFTILEAGDENADELDRLLQTLVKHVSVAAASAGTGAPDHPRAEIYRSLETAAASWEEARAALEARAVSASALANTVAAFDQDLATIAANNKAAASETVTLIAGAAFVATILLGLTTIALLWGGNVFVARPLAKTTQTIIALANGQTSERVLLGSRSLGLGALEDALDGLRRTNIEREELTRQTMEQRAQIERNLKALAGKSKEMEYLARHDALTGLPNRRQADETLGQFDNAGPDPKLYLTLLHVDVDRFKEINDTLGHEAGDKVLCHVASVLSELCEDGDTAYRIGGDEFLIVRTHQAGQPSATTLAEDIIREMNKPIDYQGHACRVGASIGIAYGNEAGGSGSVALVNADIALYQAKTSGRNQFAEFSKSLQDETVNRKALSDRLILAVERAEFVPFYQPQFYSGTLELRGLETLCRWEHPEHGILSPAHFMAQAEASALVGKIDQILMHRAARDLEWLRAQGHQIPKISFNVTADRLMHADFADVLVREMGDTTKIAIELLESMSLDKLSESVKWAIDALKDRGVEIEIDDFGSCRASIAGLIAVGPDAMKIDGEIVSPITDSPQHLRLVRAIIDIGEALGIDVIAERVETQEHINILTEQGCSILQGFALAKPMSAQDLAAFLSDRQSVRAASA